MKLSTIFALFTLSLVVKATWWAAAAQPVILSLGAVLAAIDLDVLNMDAQTIEWKNWLGFRSDRKRKRFEKFRDKGPEETSDKNIDLIEPERKWDRADFKAKIKKMKDDARYKVAYEVGDESEIEAPNALIQDDIDAFIYSTSFNNAFSGEYYDEF